jgi:excisionase family DNA binding protein
MQEHEILNMGEVAEYLRLSENTVRKLIKQGDLKAIKVGRAYRFRIEDVKSIFDRDFEPEKQQNN